MALLEHVVIATDFSPASMSALHQGVALAARFDARVTLLHVFDPAPWVPPAAIPAPRAMEERIAAEMARSMRQALEELRSTHCATLAEVETVLLQHPNAAFAICEHAAERGADLLVVGTHGRTGVAHLLIGSVAERVVRHSLCPVLTVRPPLAPG
ncbi:MAG: universal stress protein [Polyangiales bacterium]